MRNSLQDQLLKAGLANKKQAVKAKKAKNNKEKLQRSGIDVVDETAESVKAAQQAQIEKDRRLNAEINAAAEQKAVQAQIRQLIDMNRLAERGEEEFRFDHAGVIKTISVSPQQRRQLASGVLAVVSVADGYDLVGRPVAEKIMQRDNSFILCLHEKAATQSNADDASSAEYSEAEDDYSQYKVPDDLMW